MLSETVLDILYNMVSCQGRQRPLEQMKNIHLNGLFDKPNGNYLIFDIGGTLCKVCVFKIHEKSKFSRGYELGIVFTV